MFRLDGSHKALLLLISGWISLWVNAAAAQALTCAVPTSLPRPHAESPSNDNPRRAIRTASYTLAISWQPQFCHDHGDRPDAAFQCASGNRFGFVLHGLWPDGAGKDWPQYCRPVELLPEATIRANLCATPSAQLLQHEWAKHGSCMAGSADEYFRRSTGLFARLRYPDMTALSQSPDLTAGQFAAAFARANRGMTAAMMRVTANRNNYLDEIWLCLDLRYRFIRCPAHQGGVNPGVSLNIASAR